MKTAKIFYFKTRRNNELLGQRKAFIYKMNTFVFILIQPQNIIFDPFMKKRPTKAKVAHENHKTSLSAVNYIFKVTLI